MFFIISSGKKYHCPYCSKGVAKLHLHVEIIRKNQKEEKHLVTLRSEARLDRLRQHLGGFRRNIARNQVKIPHWTMPNVMDVWEHHKRTLWKHQKSCSMCSPQKKVFKE